MNFALIEFNIARTVAPLLTIFVHNRLARFTTTVAVAAPAKPLGRGKFSMSTSSGTAPPPVKGQFLLSESGFRNWITADGSSGFKAEKSRYHLYVTLACPFASRTLVMRKLKGLEDVIPCTYLDWWKDEKGWRFTDKKPKCTLDPLQNAEFLREIYVRAQPDFNGRVSVPVLYDLQKDTIVNNESSEIIRMFNSEFNEFCPTEEQKKLDFYPESLRTKIDDLNSWIYPGINIGVYRAGFAKSQEAYDQGVKGVFEALDKVEDILSKSRFLAGDTMTEADVRLFTSLVRFDVVYHGHFKCNKKRLIDYPNLWAYTRDIYQTPGITDTVDFEHITKSYYESQLHVNPLGIVPIGPDIDFMEPHGREKLS